MGLGQFNRVSPIFLDNSRLGGDFDHLSLSFEQPSFKKRRTVEIPSSITMTLQAIEKTESKVGEVVSYTCTKIECDSTDDATTDDESPVKAEESICLEKPSFKVPFFNMDIPETVTMIDTGDDAEDECIIKRCKKNHAKCGHRCNGVADESECLPCLNSECADPKVTRETSDELCAVCYTSDLGSQSCVQLSCGHIFHADCILQLVQHKWSTLKVSFAFLACPSCKAEITEDIQCEQIRNEVIQIKKQKLEVEQKALEVAKNQGLDKSERVQEGGDYHGKLLEFALHSCAFYQCFDCDKIYFGGMIDCQAALGQEQNATKEDLVCQDCQLKATGAGQEVCEKHGIASIDWKCMYCCNVALWHCFGTHWFCDRCHNEYCQPPYNQVEVRDCGGVNCPLGVPHPPGSNDHKKSSYPLGCGICRSERAEKQRQINNLIGEVSLQVNEFERK